jgi:ferredoxin-nitrite reductase
MNKVEAWKSEKHGFDVWPDVENYAKHGTPMAEIAEADLERMKWYGIFYRKRVEDGRYMIRVRIPGCELKAAQARALAEVARTGYSIIDVTTRGNVQIQGFQISDLPGVLARLDEVGLTCKQTGHDNVRNVMTHPWAGLDPDEIVDVRPLCRALTDVFMGDRELSSLPRKFNVAADGREAPAPHCWTQDTSFIASRKSDGSVVFHWLLAGTQGQNPKIAWKLPVFVTEDQAPDVLRQSLLVFREEGPREKRDKARLRYLIEKIGDAAFLEKVESKLGYTLERTDATIPALHEAEDFVGWFRQKQDGLWALGVNVPLGRLTHEQLEGLAELAEKQGDATLRTAYDQGIVVPNIPTEHRVAAARALNRLGLEHDADTVSRNIIACTGRQFCNIAVSETKGHAFGLMDRLRDKGVKLAGIKINMSGCPSSCAQTYLGDIGLKGVRVRRKAGTCDGFDVFVGGGVHETVELGILYRKGVDVDQLPEMIEELVRTYDHEAVGDQTFSQFWRGRLMTSRHFPFATDEADFRPDVWVCEKCGHRHAGEDPPVYCKGCAALRKNFVRLDHHATVTIGAEVAAAAPARPDGFSDVGAHADLVRDGRMAAKVGDVDLALFLIGDAIHCTDGLCPHEGGPLAQGEVVNGVVSCPWHGWTFRTSDGAPADGNVCPLKTYPVKVEDGRLLVSVAAAPAKVAKVAQQPEVALQVIDVVEETHDTRTVKLDNAAGSIAVHRAGQHIKVGVPGENGTTWRSFTLSSPPTRPGVIEVTVKLNPEGVVSKAVHLLRPGDQLTIKGPSGRYYFDPEVHREPLVLAVAGSGITPAMAMLRTIVDRQIDLPVTLLYGCRTRSDIIFAREIDALRVRLAGLRVVITLSQPDDTWTGPTGRVGPDLVAQHVPDPSAARFFLCGPGAMHDELTAWLLERGVPNDRIHVEMFGKAKKAVKLPAASA